MWSAMEDVSLVHICKFLQSPLTPLYFSTKLSPITCQASNTHLILKLGAQENIFLHSIRRGNLPTISNNPFSSSSIASKMGGEGPSFDENESDLSIVPYHIGTLSLHTPLAGADIPSTPRSHPPCPSPPSSPPPHHKHKIKCHLKVKHKHKIKSHLKIKHKHGKKHEHMPPHCQHKHKHSRHVEYPLGCKPHHVHKKKHRHGHINFPLGCESHYVQKKKHRHAPCCSNGLYHICYPIQAVQSKE